MRGAELAHVHWHKSSYSNGQGGNCVEVGATPGAALVRDSKQHGTGPVLAFGAAEWQAFTTGLKCREWLVSL